MRSFQSIASIHGITTRLGGVSQGVFGTMNTGFLGDDQLEDVCTNIKLTLDQMGATAKIIIATQQVHSNHIFVVDESTDLNLLRKIDVTGTALEDYSLYVVSDTDGLITKRSDVILMTFYADCVPLILHDPVRNITANAHSGWVGTANLMAKEVVNKMVALGSVRGDLCIGIGHSAGVCCYEVDEPVVRAFSKHFSNDEMKEFLLPTDYGKYHLDLKLANCISLMKTGISRTQIEVDSACTICDSHTFHSHRRAKGGPRGSMSAFTQNRRWL